MFNEHDVVRLVRPLPDSDIPIGTTGTIVFVYSKEPPVYKVEFTDDEGNTIDQLMAEGDRFELHWAFRPDIDDKSVDNQGDSP